MPLVQMKNINLRVSSITTWRGKRRVCGKYWLSLETDNVYVEVAAKKQCLSIKLPPAPTE